jgi:hypothetical protein
MDSDNCYWARLSLPENPLKDPDFFSDYQWGEQRTGYRIFQDRQLVADGVLNQIAETTGLETDCYSAIFVNFSSTRLEDRWLHSDLVSNVDPRQVKDLSTVQWRPSCFGINWELTGIDNNFYWYDVPDNVARQQPDMPPNPQYAWLYGVHFGPRRCLPGIPEGSVCLDHTVIGKRPTLIRTDIAHATEFTIPQGQGPRLSLSLRFYQDISWAEALERFSGLII